MRHAPILASRPYAHLVSVHDTSGARLKCARCARDLPEAYFCFTGHIKIKMNPYMILHELCRLCRQDVQGRWTKHPLYSPALDKYFRKLKNGAKGGANARGILFGVDKDDIMGLFIKQECLCAVTGLEMKWNRPSYRGGTNLSAPSLDRIDSNGHYVLGNVHLVLLAVNMMKRDLPHNIFIDLCKRIATHSVTLSNSHVGELK